MSELDSKCIFGGRLGNYKYYNMDDVIERAIEHAEKVYKKTDEFVNI